jgi:serine/threonine protein kinase
MLNRVDPKVDVLETGERLRTASRASNQIRPTRSFGCLLNVVRGPPGQPGEISDLASFVGVQQNSVTSMGSKDAARTPLDKTAVSRPRPADLIPGYQLVEPLGRGGMGEVHLATQLSLGRKVAVKLLAQDLAKDQAFVARFEKEAAALAALSHPNIVSIVDRGAVKGTYYLVMEAIDGPSMREVTRTEKLAEDATVKMVLDVARGVEYAHSKGVIHRDLKPENILFDMQAGGIAKVTDFGLAGFTDEADVSERHNVTEAHVSMGTLAYMAPEQRVDARKADERSDIYSLGVILYEVLAGQVPAGTYEPPSKLNGKLDKRLDSIIAKCLKASPADRYQGASELISELEPLAAPSLSSLPRKRRATQRLGDALRRSARLGRLTAETLIVVAAIAIVASRWLQDSKADLPGVGTRLSGDLGKTWALQAPGRIEPSGSHKRVVVGAGPDTLAWVGSGHRAIERSGVIYFGSLDPSLVLDSWGEKAGEVGRAELETALGEGSLTIRAEIEASSVTPDSWASIRRLAFARAVEPRGSLMVVGATGRQVALVVSAGETPPVLEWAFGSDKRGAMLGGAPLRGRTRVELNIDGRTGKLTAHVGAGKERRALGEPIALGDNWASLFAQPPRVALGCLGGSCSFRELEIVVDRGD